MPSRQRANAGLDQNPVTSSIIFREGAPSRDPQVLIIALDGTVAMLTDPFGGVHMGRTAEAVARKYNISGTVTLTEIVYGSVGLRLKLV